MIYSIEKTKNSYTVHLWNRNIQHSVLNSINEISLVRYTVPLCAKEYDAV